ncbi:hypothetical protein D3C71_958400 [compost metagenome]
MNRLLGGHQRGLHGLGLYRRLGRYIAQAHVDRFLRHLVQALQRLAQAPALTAQHFQHLQRAHDRIAGGGPVQAQQVARRFAAKYPAAFHQRLVHVTVAHVAAHERQSDALQCLLQTEVGHQRAHHRAAQAAVALPRRRQHIQQVVAVDRVALVVGHQHAVAVAVEGDAQVRTHLTHLGGEIVDVHRTHAVVDVDPVGLGTDGDHLRAQLAEQQRGDVVGGTVRAVQHDLQAAQVERTRHAGLAELDVAAHCIARAHRLAQPVRLGGGEGAVQRGLQRQFGGIVELLAIGGEELDAVVVMRVVRGTDDDAGIGAQGAGQEGHRRGRHRAEQLHIHAAGDQAGFQRRFEHVAGDARVLADHHHRAVPGTVAVALAQHPAQCIAQAQHEVGRDHALADPTADAVGAEVLARPHQAASSATGAG